MVLPHTGLALIRLQSAELISPAIVGLLGDAKCATDPRYRLDLTHGDFHFLQRVDDYVQRCVWCAASYPRSGSPGLTYDLNRFKVDRS